MAEVAQEARGGQSPTLTSAFTLALVAAGQARAVAKDWAGIRPFVTTAIDIPIAAVILYGHDDETS